MASLVLASRPRGTRATRRTETRNRHPIEWSGTLSPRDRSDSGWRISKYIATWAGFPRPGRRGPWFSASRTSSVRRWVAMLRPTTRRLQSSTTTASPDRMCGLTAAVCRCQYNSIAFGLRLQRSGRASAAATKAQVAPHAPQAGISSRFWLRYHRTSRIRIASGASENASPIAASQEGLRRRQMRPAGKPNALEQGNGESAFVG